MLGMIYVVLGRIQKTRRVFVHYCLLSNLASVTLEIRARLVCNDVTTRAFHVICDEAAGLSLSNEQGAKRVCTGLLLIFELFHFGEPSLYSIVELFISTA